MIIKIILLVGLTRLLVASEKPLLCSGIYTGIVLLFSIFSETITFTAFIIGGVLTFLLSTVYFGLLHRYSDNLLLYFTILVGGLVIGLV